MTCRQTNKLRAFGPKKCAGNNLSQKRHTGCSPSFATAHVRGCQAQAETRWRRSVADTLDGKSDYSQVPQGTPWTYAAYTNVVSGGYTLGGASSIMSASPLQQRLRDTARQQVVPQERFYAIAARNALGFPSLSGCKSVPRMESNLELPEIKGKAMSGLNPAR
jgi:hypothetical protein